jgi:hypothetical protein
MSAIGEMNDHELNQLLEKNAHRMDKLEANYHVKTKEMIENAEWNIQKAKDAFEIKEKQKEPSINFPTYGRGL